MAQKINFDTPIEYEINQKNIPVLVLKKKMLKNGILITVNCPFCGYKHRHGINEGHRASHCGSMQAKEFVTHDDGTKLYNKEGYIIRF